MIGTIWKSRIFQNLVGVYNLNKPVKYGPPGFDPGRSRQIPQVLADFGTFGRFGKSRQFLAILGKTLPNLGKFPEWSKLPSKFWQYWPVFFSFSVDIWSVGCIFAELLGRKILFQAQSPIQQVCWVLSARLLVRNKIINLFIFGPPDSGRLVR